MVIISSVDDLASSISQPLPANAAAAASASRPPASNPEPRLFDDHVTAAGTTAAAWSSRHHPPPPPYAPTTAPPTSGAFNPSPSPTTTFFPRPQPAMAEPYYCWYPPTTQLGFQQPCFAPAPLAFAQGAVPPPPVLVPMQITRVAPSSYHPQAQQGAAAPAAEGSAIAVPDTQKPQETTKPAPRRRGRPRKNATAAAGESKKPVFKPPPKRATARSNTNRAASQQTTTSVVAADSAAMAAQIQVQKPDHQQAASSDAQTAGNAPCMNPMAALLRPQQWQLQLQLPYADTSAPGVRFQPTDEELIFYLRLKHAGHREMPVDFFKDLDVYHEHPATTKAACVVVNGCWYAFSPRDRKYKNGERPKRSVIEADGEQVGYWKSNTKLAPVHAGGRADGALIGMVTSLTFHLGRQPHGIQTPWKMKEYAIPENQHAPDGSAMLLNDWVVCKLFYKKRAIVAAKQEDQVGEAGENVSRAEGDEGSMPQPQVVSTDETTTLQVVSTSTDETTPGSSEQDLWVQDYDLGRYDDTIPR